MVGSRMPRARIQIRTRSSHGWVRSANRRSPGAAAGSPAFQEGRRQLDPEDEHVGHDAEGHFEQGGIEVPFPEEERHLPDVPRAAHVDQDRQSGHRVAEGAGQHGRPHQRVVASLVEHVDDQRHRVAAAGDGRAGDDVVGDPQAPGIAVGEVGGGAEAGGEAPDDQGDAEAAEGQEELVQGRHQAPPDRLSLRRCMHGFLLSSPASPGRSPPAPCLRLRNITAPSTA